MFEEIPAIIIFLLFSLVVSYLLLKYTPEPFKKIIVGLMIVGIIIHEFFHVVMCIITNTPIKNVSTFTMDLKCPERSIDVMISINSVSDIPPFL